MYLDESYEGKFRPFLIIGQSLNAQPEIYIKSAPNNLNETHTFMCLGRAGRFGQH